MTDSHFIKEMLSILFTQRTGSLLLPSLKAVMYELKSSTWRRPPMSGGPCASWKWASRRPTRPSSVYRHIRPEKLLNQGIIKEKTPVINQTSPHAARRLSGAVLPGHESLLVAALARRLDRDTGTIHLRDDLPGQQDCHGRLQAA
ncbi:MAG: hypothetical protein MZV70_73015 [Desulfobacterales bacterium]|nr:hypothetical protein [Desulfobacterales bacterium]